MHQRQHGIFREMEYDNYSTPFLVNDCKKAINNYYTPFLVMIARRRLNGTNYIAMRYAWSGYLTLVSMHVKLHVGYLFASSIFKDGPGIASAQISEKRPLLPCIYLPNAACT